jgi:subtilase family serine protease
MNPRLSFMDSSFTELKASKSRTTRLRFVNLEKTTRKLPLIALAVIPILLINPAIVTASSSSTHRLGVMVANPHRTFAGADLTVQNVNSRAPFCLGITCYTPAMIAKAYNFPPTTGPNGLDGTGSNIVIVDAFGSPTVQNDLNVFDSAFGLPPTTVNILCGPTWTGSASDHCPATSPGSPIDNICGEEGWAFETTLDVQMAHAMAPGATIYLVVSDDCFDTNFNAAELAVTKQHSLRGSIMSQSFGEPDFLAGCTKLCPNGNASIIGPADEAYRTAVHNHWTVLASSGDDGANEAFTATGFTNGTMVPSWPSTNPFNLAVGGTQGSPYLQPGVNGPVSCPANTNCNTGLVVVNGGPNGCGRVAKPPQPPLFPGCTPVGYGGESSWQEFNTFGVRTSTGGGVSTLYERPSYQDNLPESFSTLLGATVQADNGRITPDVSFNAAINGGILNYDGFVSLFGGPNGFYILAGTSASSPAWAGIIALVNQKNGEPVGFINPAIYELAHSKSYAHAFHDITGGNNSDTGGQACTIPSCGFNSPALDGFNAGKGYDLTTGWGTPNVSNFITDILQFAGQNNQDNQA